MTAPARLGAAILAIFLLALGPAPVLAAGVSQQDVRIGPALFTRTTLPQRDGPPVVYWLSRPDRPAPIVLYIQGSGCSPAFIKMGASYASTIFSLITLASTNRYAVMVVDKPFAATGFPPNPGSAKGCGEAFNNHFSLPTWLDAVQTAYRHARTSPWVDKRRSLVIGISEGATVAAALAAKTPLVTDVALVGGSGPGQMYDFVAGAYAAHQPDSDKLAALTDLDNQVKAILADPDDGSKMAWGHPYKRWATFFRSSSLQNLLRSKARVYLVSGMADTNVPILSTEVLYTELLTSSRDVTFRRIPDAGHDLLPVGADFSAGAPRMEAEFARITRWFERLPDAP